ncbi:MAG TPA: IS481 family transposase [Planctomycetaceae bacterium]|nr:IS481 family transposase [Planctomycetaceae bacterium]
MSLECLSEKERARLQWVKLFGKVKDAGLVCRRCGISRPTLRKWVRRFEKDGIAGLRDRSRRPKTSPATKVTARIEKRILKLRKRRLGVRRIQNELMREHNTHLSLATLQKVLVRNGVSTLAKRRRKKPIKTYEKDVPGERMQLDTCKIAPGIYQYTAVDDCTRYRVLGIYKRRSAANTLLFLERVVEETPFPIQRIQTDRGREFFAEKVQRFMMEYCIKFRPIKPRSPHLNGKVERSQRTDLEEFYATQNLKSPKLENRLFEWQHFYNWHRPHGSLKGKTPIERCSEKSSVTPFYEDIELWYQADKEWIQNPDYNTEMRLRRLKQSV